jgi:hypothetical protein
MSNYHCSCNDKRCNGCEVGELRDKVSDLEGKVEHAKAAFLSLADCASAQLPGSEL